MKSRAQITRNGSWTFTCCNRAHFIKKFLSVILIFILDYYLDGKAWIILIMNQVAISCILLFQCRNLHYLHIVVDQILTCHTPDKGIVAGTCCTVDTPLWSNHSLLVVQPDRTCLRWLTHYVENLLTLWYIIIEVKSPYGGGGSMSWGWRSIQNPPSTRVVLPKLSLR